MRLTIAELALPLVHTFTIARGSATTARTAIFRLSWREREGLGESAPIARYNESVDSVIAYFAAHAPQGDDPYALEALLEGIPPAARCGLDLALHDLIGKDVDRPLWQLLGLDPARTPRTSFTIGIDTLETTLAKVAEIREHPILKLKLGTPNDIEIVEAVRSHYTGTLRIDANEGWTPEQAVGKLRELERFEIEFCEQPIPAGTPDRLRWIRERSGIPLVSDEDSLDAKDLPALRGCVDGVNVKLGCMGESAILATAAAHLSPLGDWADLDGPFLTRDDPFAGITYDRGKIALPSGPGLGVRERASAPA